MSIILVVFLLFIAFIVKMYEQQRPGSSGSYYPFGGAPEADARSYGTMAQDDEDSEEEFLWFSWV